MKRLLVAVLVTASLGLSASPSFASYHRRYVRQRVIVTQRVVRPTVVEYRTVRRVYHPRHRAARFIPLPVPRRVPVPPPFRHLY